MGERVRARGWVGRGASAGRGTARRERAHFRQGAPLRGRPARGLGDPAHPLRPPDARRPCFWRGFQARLQGGAPRPRGPQNLGGQSVAGAGGGRAACGPAAGRRGTGNPVCRPRIRHADHPTRAVGEGARPLGAGKGPGTRDFVGGLWPRKFFYVSFALPPLSSALFPPHLRQRPGRPDELADGPPVATVRAQAIQEGGVLGGRPGDAGGLDARGRALARRRPAGGVADARRRGRLLRVGRPGRRIRPGVWQGTRAARVGDRVGRFHGGLGARGGHR